MKQDIRNTTVIGAGQIGHGVAQLFAQAGFHVNLVSRREKTLEEALRRIRCNLKLLQSNRIATPVSAGEVISRITTTTMANLSMAVLDSDFVVEALPEELSLKKETFKNIDRWSPRTAILATSTSGLSITELGMATSRPEKVVGTHFLGQPHLMPIVEVVRGKQTSTATFESTCRIIRKIGKYPIKVHREVPGFILNRLQHAMWREAIALLQTGVATAPEIDKTVKMGFGLRLPVVGPLEFMDLVGLDLVLDIHKYLLKDLDGSVEPQELLKDKVRRGDLGAKSRKGFYVWSKGRARKLSLILDSELIDRMKKIRDYGPL